MREEKEEVNPKYDIAIFGMRITANEMQSEEL